jgi:glutamate-1-semialdehyde 2,1-aminomutase
MTEADITGALDAAEAAFAALKRQAPGLGPVEKLAFLSAGAR